MSEITLDQHTALVLIDLQKGILALPVVTPAERILSQGIRLADAFRAAGLPVILVKVAWSPDGGDLPPTRTDRPGPATAPPAEFSALPAELTTGVHDIVITKRHWGAFTGTELDLQLRRRGVKRIVLAGIATSIGVESTARSAWEHGYDLVLAEDATTDLDADAHAHTFGKIFPRIGQVRSTDEILTALKNLGG
ncbi:hydrolase [Streptomyces sp. NBC_01264]|uniref:hydrolase n=1 Tax=Streptomyces sp. NBC_01264 TaxID=2903804 RepID=UPI002251C57F|nr:hydrolase [Streptomyces sp. NBC_01264]MCX4781944.1 hydrolase [Streptomyces sp. NBC_01264]